jgi:fructokinase
MNFKVIGLGEVLWDLMPDGKKQLGGAPANFACHARSLGANAYVVTRVGDDSLGHEVLRRFEEMEVAPDLVQVDASQPTGTVEVTLDTGGVPLFTIREDVAWDRLALTEEARNKVQAADAVCFGSLAQRNPIARGTIRKLLAAAPAHALRIFDINLRQQFYSREIIEHSLQLANVLKLNDVELAVLAEMFSLGKSPQQQIEQLARAFGLQLVVLTRGPHGSLLYQQGRWSEQLPQPVQVVDTVGAGDAFTAALVIGLLKEMDLNEVHALASEVARYVCMQAGATPSLPEYLRNKFTHGDDRNARAALEAIPAFNAKYH